ncbi:LysR family transcriptional regulator [Paraglaciecola sp.]|uniref:LysR family transcriptional regulator n=1 Tax=Paraglaciecola sp. TaxID=1920173 RepID=UPI003EF9F841
MPDLNNIQKLDLNLLKVFESIYLERNMSRSAEALHITPSAVSHGLKRLREYLGDPLFQRSNNQMLPTPACQRMAPLIIDNLTRLRQILQHWGEFNPLTSEHHFSLGIHYALEPSILPKLATMLASQAPHVTFASVKVERENLSRLLTAGHVDMVFDVALPIKSPVLHQKLIDDEFCILINKEHALADNMSKLDYLQANHIGVSNRPSGAIAEDALLQRLGLSRNISVRCQNYYAAKLIIQTSDLILTVPSMLAKELLAQQKDQGNLVIRELPLELNKLETHMYWHKNTEQDEALSWFRQQTFKLWEKL